MLRIHTLGGLSVHDGERQATGAAAQPRRLAVLALVARAGERGVTRERVMSLLWPDAPEEQGRNALKQAVYALRRDLGSEEALLGGHQLRLNSSEVGCDVSEFEAALAAGDLERAVQLYHGPFLDGFRLPRAAEFERWSDEERADLANVHATALERLARRAAERGDAAGAVSWYRKLAARDPLNARIACELMRALAAAGDRNGALQHARIYEALIEEELELPPDREVVALAEQMRADPRAFAVAAPPPVPQPRMTPTHARGAVASAPSPLVLSVAVLPFASMSADADSEYFGDGITEEIITALARLPGLRVAAGTVTFALKGRPVDLADIGARLAVDAVLEGSVRRSGSRLRTTARLVDIAGGFPIWSERFDFELGDEFAIQDHIASAIAERMSALIDAAGLRIDDAPSTDHGVTTPRIVR